MSGKRKPSPEPNSLDSSYYSTQTDIEDTDEELFNESHLHYFKHQHSFSGKTKPFVHNSILVKSKTWDSIPFPDGPVFNDFEAVNSLSDRCSIASSSDSGIKIVDDEDVGCSETLYDSLVKPNRTDKKLYDKNADIKFKQKKHVPDSKTEKNLASASRSQNSLIRPKPKRDPLPMKLRALPLSFWQQPNNTNVLSPGEVYPVLPPLSHLDEDGREGRREGIVSDANTELLFSLFRNVEEQQQRSANPNLSRPHATKRGRPKKAPSSLKKNALKDDDPCLVNSITDSILPLIPERPPVNSLQAQIAEGQQVLAMVSFNRGEKSMITLPNLNIDNNYSQILSQLVVQL